MRPPGNVDAKNAGGPDGATFYPVISGLFFTGAYEGAGCGRELADEGIEAYFETKSVMMNLNE